RAVIKPSYRGAEAASGAAAESKCQAVRGDCRKGLDRQRQHPSGFVEKFGGLRNIGNTVSHCPSDHRRLLCQPFGRLYVTSLFASLSGLLEPNDSYGGPTMEDTLSRLPPAILVVSYFALWIVEWYCASGLRPSTGPRRWRNLLISVIGFVLAGLTGA